MVHVYGIPNCDTVKKALVWLQKNNIGYVFHDFKKEGVTKEKLQQWLSIIPLEKLGNKKSTAWKGFTIVEQVQAGSKAGGIYLMQLNTNFIKRPVLEIAGTILCGFNEESYKITFTKK
jgi:arsenate reductase